MSRNGICATKRRERDVVYFVGRTNTAFLRIVVSMVLQKNGNDDSSKRSSCRRVLYLHGNSSNIPLQLQTYARQ